MKRVLVCIVLLAFVATAVFAVDLLNVRPLQRAVRPYVEQWGEYSRYIIDDDDAQGMLAAFQWWDEWGQPVRWVVFAYIDGAWEVYEASEELVQIPANIS